ncbi:MAG: hypothetical protein ACKV2V_03845 [Blastocatellia bacterium]
MNAGLILSDAARLAEMQVKRAELEQVETRLAQAEAERARVRGELHAFESRYLSTVGELYDELAGIEKEIAGIQGLLVDDEAGKRDSLADDEVGCGQNRLHSDKLRKLYRDVCRKFHPDLSGSETEREHRHQLMVEINRAYEAGAEDHLAALLDAGATNVELAPEQSVELLVLTRSLSQARERLLALENDLAEILSSETWRLKLRVENAESMGMDLFADLIAQVRRQIFKASNRLEALRGVMMTA